MHQLVQLILDWSEVWALLIPIIIYKKQPVLYRPVVFYLWCALFINLTIDCIWKFRMIIPPAYNSNNYLYNVHSVVRFGLFTIFYLKLNQPFLIWIKKVVPILFVVFFIINFGYYESFFNYSQFSSRLLAVEAFFMLFYVLQYYLFKINENVDVNIFTPDFWITSGLGIYMVINFFIFLLYNELSHRLETFAISLWNVHNISFIIFNLFIAKSLYESGKQ